MSPTVSSQPEKTCCGPDCCAGDGQAAGQTAAATVAAADADAVRRAVRDGYAAIARGEQSSCCSPKDGGCGSASPEEFARAIGYAAEELAALPEGANMGLSCGNPTALAELRPGEVVLDLGAGGGFDVFLAAARVGPTGRAIGVDMTADMVEKARANAAAHRERTGADNVDFRLGEIEHLPVADASVDAVISNCVINLSPHKPQVWREVARVLKPGGRVAVSDIALKQPLPAEVIRRVAALVGCVAGAVLVSETEAMARAAGLVDVQLEERSASIDAMSDWHDPLYREVVAGLPAGAKVSDYVTSLSVRARKPGRAPA